VHKKGKSKIVLTKKRQKSLSENLMTSPGTVTYIGPEIELKTRIHKIQYNQHFYQDLEVKTLAECSPSTDIPDAVSWLNVDGIHETGVIEKIGQLYNLHPLLLEDIVNTEHKPKLEIFDHGHLFLTLKMLHISSESVLEISSEHVSFVLGDNFLLSFQEERTQDIFSPVLNRLQVSVGKTRRNGADYLLFALLDVIVDHYFVVLEKFAEHLESIEDQVISGTVNVSLANLYALKRELSWSRRSVWPLRDMINQLIREDNQLLGKEVIPYFRDLYDHTMQVIDTIESYRELLASLVDVHLSTLSNRMNSVMKTLTIFSAIFMPLTFIVGVYGMNFKYMPELDTRYGYFVIWGMMIFITLGMVVYFKRRNWM
jgi:magnesium transporter